MQFGKGHSGAAGTDPKVYGFEVRIGGREAGGCGSYSGLQNLGAKRNPKGPWRARNLDQYFGQNIHLTEALTLEAKREIRDSVKAKQPFFCYFAHHAPHTSIEPDQRFAPRYRAAGLDETEACYASLTEGVDKSVGDLLALLYELGVVDNTLVVSMFDNGGLSHHRWTMSAPHTHNAPLSSGKGTQHEGGIREPLPVRWPGKTKPANVNQTPVMIYDWFPTLPTATGAASPTVDGLNLATLLQGQSDARCDRPLVWHLPNFPGPTGKNTGPLEGPGMGASSTLRHGDWKLIYYHPDQRFELFDLAHDLGEKNNLAKADPRRAREMAAKPTSLVQQNPAPIPVVKATGLSAPLPLQGFAQP